MMTREQAIAKAREIRRATAVNLKTGVMKVNGKEVKSIPCYRCGGLKTVKLGNDAFAGTGPCYTCNQTGSITFEQKLGNDAANAKREQDAAADFESVFKGYDKLMKTEKTEAASA